MADIYDSEQTSQLDESEAKAEAEQRAREYQAEAKAAAENWDVEGMQRAAEKAYAGVQGAYTSYAPGGPAGYEGSGLFNPTSALFGGSGASAELAYQDVDTSVANAMDANRWANQVNTGRVDTSNQYGQTAIGNANATLGGSASELSGLGNTGAANALAIRGVGRAGTEGMDIQSRQASMLGLFDPSSVTASDALSRQTQNNAAAMRAIGLSGRGGGVNASAQARGDAMAHGIMAGEGLQQQQLTAQEYQSNQALALQALQGQAALGASQQQGALGNAQLSQAQQIAAAGASMAGLQTQYGADASANQLRVQQAGNLDEYAKTQQGLYGALADSQQTLGQTSANYLGQAQDLHQQQLGTEAQLRTQGIVNASQTAAGLQNTRLDINTRNDIADQAANTAMLGSMLSTGAAAVGGRRRGQRGEG